MEPARLELLIVEADPEIRHLLTVVLDGEDREVTAVTTGREAQAVLERRQVDLVVLDLILPDVDGRNVLAAMRRSPETATTPVVVVSARGGREIRQDCYELGADHFTEKPFDPDELVAEVGACLERAGDRERVSLHDPVTGLLNRAGFLEAGPTEGTPYALALIQIDGFLSLSERWGWAEAEAILKRVGEAVQKAVAGSASVDERVAIVRIGGGEFAFVLPRADLEGVTETAGAVLESLRALDVADPEGEAVPLTASIGVLTAAPGTPVEQTLDAARPRVFQARRAGGNRVVGSDAGDETLRARILVAEDDEISATILTHRLQKEGLEIARYDNGRKAYQAALQTTPNLVILDVKMPGMDGFEVLERLRRVPAYATVPIVLLTSMGSEADVVRGFQLGADDYILKPFSPVELTARVWRLLRRGRSTSTV